MALTRVTEERAVAAAETPAVAVSAPTNDVRVVIQGDTVVARPLTDDAKVSPVTNVARVNADPGDIVRVVSQPQVVAINTGVVGVQGPPGDQGLFIQPTQPAGPPPYLWIQTGLGQSGSDMTFWVDDAA